MATFAKNVGAMRGDHIDWYAVAEILARIAVPELMEDEKMQPGPGAPKKVGLKNDDDFLAMEIHRVMLASNCAVAVACERISRGDKVLISTPLWGIDSSGKPAKLARVQTVGSPWKEIPPKTLERRYFAWLKKQKVRQQAERASK
jgi:hypothetical protein